VKKRYRRLDEVAKITTTKMVESTRDLTEDLREQTIKVYSKMKEHARSSPS